METLIDDKTNKIKTVRKTPIRSIKNQFRLVSQRIIPSKKSGVKEPKGGGSGGNSFIIKGFYRYTLQEIRGNGEPIRTRCFDWSFNKPKLIGAIIRYRNRSYRVKSVI